MAMDVTGTAGSGGNQLRVIPETDAAGSPDNVGTIRIFGENDAGSIRGETVLRSPEVDVEYRLRVGQDLVVDEEVFSYSAQNTGKHALNSTTMTAAFAAGQVTLNASSITTINTGAQLATYATFPNVGTQTLSLDMELAFTAQPTANLFVEAGLGIAGSQTAAPTDGVFLRLSGAGLQLIAANNGTETSSGVFPLANGAGTWVYQNNKRYQYIIYLGGVVAQCWMNDGTGAVLMAEIVLPAAQGRIIQLSGVQFFCKQRIGGTAAGAVLQTQLGAYNVRLGGSNLTSAVSTQGNRIHGAYQGAAGGTMGSLASYANSVNPIAGVPSNIANLVTALGGQVWETDTLAAGTDGIIMGHQVPAISVSGLNRRLVLCGVKIGTFVQTSLTGGGYVAQWSIAFGSTGISLATGEGVITKAPRRVALGLQAVASGALAGVVLSEMWLDLGDAPIFVNPGEWLQFVKKKVGTAPTAGVLGHIITPAYGWE